MLLAQFKEVMNVPPASRKWYLTFSRIKPLPTLCLDPRLTVAETRRIILEIYHEPVNLRVDVLDALLVNPNPYVRATVILRGRLTVGQMARAIESEFEELCNMALVASDFSYALFMVRHEPEAYQELACHYHRGMLNMRGWKKFPTKYDTLVKQKEA